MIPEVNTEKAIFEHIKMVQDIIKRMASNSSSCKQWCIVVISAILTLATKKDANFAQTVEIAYIPLVMFLFLDCYYLGLERGFRLKHQEFISKMQKGNLKCTDFFMGSNKSSEIQCAFEIAFISFFKTLWQTIKSFFSFSIIPFYGTLAVFIYLISK